MRARVCLPTYDERENLEPMLRALSEVLGPDHRVLLRDVPRLIEAATGADVVLGSRYVRGGTVRDWGFLRRAVSRAGSLYTQLLLMPVKDATGGFKCFRRAVLERLDLDVITARGYMLQIETTFRAPRAGFRVVEIPIAFRDRRVGSSKMSRAIVLEAIWKVPALRLAALRGRV